MPIVTLENGLKINFTSTPKPEDVQHVIDHIHREQSNNSFLKGIVSKYFTSPMGKSPEGGQLDPSSRQKSSIIKGEKI